MQTVTSKDGTRIAYDRHGSARRASVTMPTQVVYGSKTMDVLRQGSRALAEVLPSAELRELEGVSHNVKMPLLAPVLAEFFTATTPGGYPHPATRASRLSAPPAP
jgi:hypothetical protein